MSTPPATIPPASTTLAPGEQIDAVLQPPVSASDTLVYFRDGDTKVRSLSPGGQTADVTTVPGGPTTVSFFSVSPDDKRIAVLVEDLSGPTTIALRLYVEDLVGHGHHADIYSTSIPKGRTGTTLWPMGWHEGALVLAVMVACTNDSVGLRPIEWHVSSATTADRIATIRAKGCNLTLWPSPAGVACVGRTGNAGPTTVYDWSGKAVASSDPGHAGNWVETGLSPSGQRIFFDSLLAPTIDPNWNGTWTVAVQVVGSRGHQPAWQHSACEWIDDDHVLAPDAVIGVFSVANFPGVTAVQIRSLPAAGVCAGRFPGGL